MQNEKLLLLLMFLAAGSISCLVWGFRLYRRTSGWDRGDRLALSFLPGALFVLAGASVGKIVAVTSDMWGACRLTPTIAMFHGYDLYYPQDSGPILNTIYGPVSWLLYSPAALARSPTGAVLIAASVTMVLATFPILLYIMKGKWLDQRARLIGLGGFIFCLGAILQVGATESMARGIQADASTLAFGILACLVATGGHGAPRLKRLSFAALLAILAVWAKQVEAPLALALMAYLGLCFGWKYLMRFTACFAVLGLFISAIFSMIFGYKELFLNLITIPSRHPWQGATWNSLAIAFQEMLGFSIAFLILLVLLIVILTFRSPRTPISFQRLQTWSRRDNSSVLFLATLFMIPTSLLGAVKVGGYMNSYHSLYYFILAVSTMWTNTLVTPNFHTNNNRLKVPFYVFTAVCVILIVPSMARLYGLTHLRDNVAEQAYKITIEHPEQVYFPWQPLSTLLAEGKLYHFEYGVLDRQLAGFQPSNEHFRFFLPSRLRYVMYPEQPPLLQTVLSYFPGFSYQPSIEGFKGWKVFVHRDTSNLDRSTTSGSPSSPLFGEEFHQ